MARHIQEEDEKELQQFRSSLLMAPQREADLVVGPKERGFFGEMCLEIEGRLFLTPGSVNEKSEKKSFFEILYKYDTTK